MKTDEYRLDDGFLDHIAIEIGTFIAKWGRIHVTDMKEKNGTVRVYCFMGNTSLHSLLYPMYMFKHKSFPLWLWKLDIYHLTDIITFVAKRIGFYKYQKFIYRQAYKNAVGWYPHRKSAIINGADYLELLEGI